MPIIPTMPIVMVNKNAITHIQPYEVKDYKDKVTLYWDDPVKGLVQITEPDLEELSKISPIITY